MSFAQTWNEADPAGTDYIRDGDNSIRNFKIAFRERFAVDHYAYSDETGYSNVGEHKKITFGEHSGNPTAVTDKGFLFCKNDGGDTELYWMDAAGNVVQITGDGIMYGSDNYLLADGTVPLTADWDAGSYKITAEQFESDVETGTAPFIVASTTQVDNLNAQYVGGLAATEIGTIGTSASKSDSTSYLAETDGIVMAYSNEAPGSEICMLGYTDGSNPPTTTPIRQWSNVGSGGTQQTGITFGVKKGNYWRVVGQENGFTSATVTWLPLGS